MASEHLQLNEDRTSVRRVTAVPSIDPSEADPVSIYVEGFGPATTLDSLTSCFARFGQVAYVSLPRFEVSRQAKGFAFVEFADQDAAGAAVRVAAAGELDTATEIDHTNLRTLPLGEWRRLRGEYSAMVKKQRATDQSAAELADCGLRAVAQAFSESANSAAAYPSGHGADRARVLVRVHGVPEKTTKATLRARLSAVAAVEYVDFKKGTVHAVVRLSTAADREALLVAFPKPAASADGAHFDAFYAAPLEESEEDEYMTRLAARTAGSSGTPVEAVSLPTARGKRAHDESVAAAAHSDVVDLGNRRKKPKKKDRIHIKFEE